MMKKIATFAKRKSVIAGAVVLALLGTFFFIRTRHANAEVRYVLAEASRGTMVVSVDGSGQVEATQQLDLTAKGSGDVVFVGVKKGEAVKTGTLLVQIDTKDAVRAVRDAQTNLETAQLSLEKTRKGASAASLMQAEHAVLSAQETLNDLRAPADASSLLSAQNAVTSAQESIVKAERDAVVSHEDAYSAVIDGHRDLSSAMQGLRDVLTGHDLESGRENAVVLQNTVFTNDRERIAQLARTADAAVVTSYASYDLYANAVAASGRTTDNAAIEALIDGAVTAAKDMSDAIRAEDAVVHGVDEALVRVSLPVPAGIAGLETDLAALTADADGTASSLLSRQTALRNAQLAIDAAQRSLAERQNTLNTLTAGSDAVQIASAERRLAEVQQTLTDLKAGPDALELRSQELTVRARHDALADAEETLSEYVVVAPFDGIVAEVSVKTGDAVTAGKAVVTMITESKLARVSLNEVDTVKVKAGQKVSLTFDALPELSIAGTVAEVDILGAASQGVVSYDTVIAFETQDDRIRPGMSAAASIVTDLRTDALLVPSAAVRATGDASSVQVLPGAPSDASALAAIGVVSNTLPEARSIRTGLDNGQMVEVLEGLTEGERVVVRTIASGAQTSATAAASGSAVRIPGMGGNAFGGSGGGQRGVTR